MNKQILKYLRFLIIWLLIIIFINPIFVYTYNKTLWKSNTDCMIYYINKSYPLWQIYYNYWSYHIDQRGLNYWSNLWLVNWCIHQTNNFYFNLTNSVYCFYTLTFEKIWKNFYL